MKLGLSPLLLVCCQLACTGGRFSDPDLALNGPGKRLSLEEVSGYDGKPSGSPMRQKSQKSPAKAGVSSPHTGVITVNRQTLANPRSTSALQANCEALLGQRLPTLRRLVSLLEPTRQASLDPFVSFAISKLSPEHCIYEESRRRTMAAMEAFFDQSSPRIGMILPLTGARSKLATLVLEGMRAAFHDHQLKFDDFVILKDSAGVAANAERAFAELLLIDRVKLVIGGLETAETDVLVKNSLDATLPVVLLSREREPIASSNYAFRVYPDEQRLAETLAAGAKQRQLNRIAILKPAGGKSNAIAKYFAKAVKDQGGQIPFDIVYTPGNFDSMSAAARQLFRTDTSLRREEYQQAYQDARKRAEQEGVPFDPRMVLLKPIIDFDAVFLPDDFRTARHFAKLFKFHMVNKIALIGNHEWRSPGLIQPFDELFEGSFFADFIGAYNQVPASIAAPTLGSPFFIHPQAVVPTDFRLIGYRVAHVATETLRLNTPRRDLPSQMLEIVSQTQDMLPQGKIFAPDRNIAWPTYLFNVRRHGLNIENDTPSYQSLPLTERPSQQPTISSHWTPVGVSR